MTKAMILAAGHGIRMRPLSETTPKPLLKIGAYTLIEHHLIALQAIGVTEVVMNVHHLSEKIMAFLGDGSRYDVNIHYSQEEKILGPAGGIKNALSLLGPEPFILISADIYTDYPYSNLLHTAQTLNNTDTTILGHLVLVDNPNFLPNGDFGFDQNGYLNFQSPKFTYANLGVLHPKLFTPYPLGHLEFNDVILPAIKNKCLTGEHYQGLWHNVGTPEQLKKVRMCADKTRTNLKEKI